jgi:hypothetical protein
VVVARHRSRFSELVRGSVAAQLRRLLPGTPVEEVRDRAEGRNLTGSAEVKASAASPADR